MIILRYSRKKPLLRVGIILDINQVVGHGLVCQLVQDGADGIKVSVYNQQLGLGFFLVKKQSSMHQTKILHRILYTDLAVPLSNFY